MMLALLLVSCSLTSMMPDSHHYHHYLFGAYASATGDHPLAERSFDIVFGHNGPHYAYEGLMQHFNRSGQFHKIITFIPNIEKHGALSIATQHLYAQALEHEGHTLQASTLFAKLAQEKPTDAEIMYHAVTTSVAAKNIDQAMKLIETYLSHDGTHRAFLFHFLRAQILSQLDKDEAALKELDQAVSLQPRFEQAWLLLGIIHQKNGHLPEALNAFKECAACGNSNPMLDRQIKQLERALVSAH